MALDQETLLENELRDLRQRGERILEGVTLRSFTATPEQVGPFEEAVLSWDVAGPTDEFGIRIGSFFGPAQGNLTVSPRRQTNYQLEAVALGASKRLGVAVVDVNLSVCCQNVIPENVIQAQAQQFLNTLLSGSDQVSLRNSAADITVNTSTNGMDIEIPLRLEINNFFDADVDVVLKFTVGVHDNLSPRVKLQDAKVDVRFHWAEHLLSFGSASAVQGVAQVTIEAMLESVLRRCVEEDFELQISRAAETLCPGSGRSGFQAVSTTNEGIAFTYCPLPNNPLVISFGVATSFTELAAFNPV